VASHSRADYIGYLRDFLRDHPAFNRLLNYTDEESNERQLGLALDLALDHFNTRILPIGTTYGYESFPSVSMLMELGAVYVLEMVGILKTRNSLQYSDAGLTISDTEKSAEYLSWARAFRDGVVKDAMNMKKAANIASVLEAGGGLHSSYNSL